MNNNLNIGNKIGEYRREKGATQEQLADYVGVSVAAVSKWETNQSYPDITLLPSIADFFEVTIDSLLDYMITDKQEKYKQIRDSIQEPVLNGDYNAVLPVTLEALKKYPNDFELLEITGRMMSSKSWTSKTKEQDLKDAVYYLERALKCAETKEELKYQRIWIKKSISYVYEYMGDIDTALKKLCEINESGAFDIEIARVKYKKGEKKEAARLLQVKLWDMAFNFWMVAGKLAQWYEEEGNFEMALESQKLHAQFLSAFIHDTPNYADEICCHSYFEIAKFAKKLERYDEMWHNLEKAVYHAVRFDKNPSYLMTSLKFMDALVGINRISNSSSNLVCEGILKELKSDFNEYADDERYLAFCCDLESAKKTKVEAGVWVNGQF